jgi:SAP domain-containing ribonucleoprotein
MIQTTKAAVPSTKTPAPPPITHKSPISEEDEDEELKKRKQRAQRFGIALVEPTKPPAKVAPAANSKQIVEVFISCFDGYNPVLTFPQDPEKLNERAKRFGTGRGKSPTATAATGQKRTAPAEVDPEEAERRRRRAERFGTAVVVR